MNLPTPHISCIVQGGGLPPHLKSYPESWNKPMKTKVTLDWVVTNLSGIQFKLLADW